jgi:hypothetical protein
MRSHTLPTRSPPRVGRPSPWTALGWIPAGFAASRFVAEDTPILAIVVLAVGVAALHRLTPGLVEVVGGGGGFLLSLFAAADPRGCGTGLGSRGVGVVLVYGSVMTVSAFVRLLGTANGRAMAKHLLVATGALELSLFVAGSAGRSGFGVHDELPVLALALFVTTLVGMHARHGFALLGGALLVALAALAIADVSCAIEPVGSLVGSAVFALGAYAMTERRTLSITAEGG